MTELNKYNLYSLNNKTDDKIVDQVDSIITKIDRMEDFKSVYEYISTNLGEIEDTVVFEFEKTNKRIGVILKEDAIECFGLVGDTNFYKKGWRKTE